MKITVNNIDRSLRIELAKTCTFVDINQNPDGVFMEWSSQGTNTYNKQKEILDVCVSKKIPLIIFDRNLSIPDEKVSSLIGNGAFLWEPAVNDRMFFSYQPVWGEVKRRVETIPYFETEGRVDLAYMSSLSKKVSNFKDYYQPVSEIGDFQVVYFDTVANPKVNKKVHEMGITVYAQSPSDVHSKAVILVGSDHDYQTGRLDPKLFDYLEQGIVPLLPREHRYFHAVFGDLVVGTEDDVEYILKFIDKMSFGCIYDMYQNLDAYLPEADVKNVAKRITKYFS